LGRCGISFPPFPVFRKSGRWIRDLSLAILQAKKRIKKDKNQLFETAVKQPPGGYTNSTKYEKAPQDFE
jgi:hypothetical protein